MPKAILIDPFNQTLTAMVIDPETRISSIIGAPSGFTRFGKKSETIYFDDVALLREETSAAFRLQGIAEPLLGKALVVGAADRKGYDTDTTFSVETLAPLVTFLGEKKPYEIEAEIKGQRL